MAPVEELETALTKLGAAGRAWISRSSSLPAAFRGNGSSTSKSCPGAQNVAMTSSWDCTDSMRRLLRPVLVDAIRRRDLC